jgi:branched-chain amino acid transport system ATP-binding protein
MDRRQETAGMTTLRAPQNANEALDLADRGYVIQTGRIVGQGTGKELLASDQFRQAFLGI